MADERYRLVKLVRDDVAQFNAAEGVVYRPVPDTETFRKLLIGKVGEEALEFVQDPSVGELADVLEAIESIAALLWGPTGVGRVRAKMIAKREERGGFQVGVGMYVLSDNRRSPHEDGAVHLEKDEPPPPRDPGKPSS